MPYRKEELANGEYYHIMNRGVDGRDIFTEEGDYKRFLEGLKEFNTSARIKIRDLRYIRQNTNPIGGISTNRIGVNESLVEILCYCLLPNHFHLLVKQITDDGVAEFLRKIGIGYTHYFNIKTERQGHLFQGRFRAVHISREAHFLHISRYIHLNALDLLDTKWREGALKDWDSAKKQLESYPWSSYRVFIGQESSEFCRPEMLGEIFKTPRHYEDFLKGWTKRNYGDLREYVLE